MIGANQFLAANTTRDYPLVLSPEPNANQQAWLADAFFGISTDAAIFVTADPIKLVEIVVSGALVSFAFAITAGPLSGWVYSSAPAALSDLQRVSLGLYDTASQPRPEKGYGYIIVGSASSLPTSTTPLALPVVPSVIRPLDSVGGLVIRVANSVCPGDTTLSESPLGAPNTIRYTGWVSSTIPGCVDIGVYPLGDPHEGTPVPQNEMIPDPTGSTTTPIAIAPPTLSVDVIEAGTVASITTQGLLVTDTLPGDPGYDAIGAPGGPLIASPVFTGGANIDLGYRDPSGIVFSFRLGGGTGVSCGAPACLPGTSALNAVKSINGVHGNLLTFAAGTNVEILTSPRDHRIYLISNSEGLVGAQAWPGPLARIVESLAGNVLSLDGTTSTTPYGAITGYAWSFSPAPSGTWTTGGPTSGIAQFTFSALYTGTIRLVVTASTGDTGAATAPVSYAGDPPLNVGAPEVTGDLTVGTTVTCSQGTWTGTPTITYTYAWSRNGVPITGATASSYVVTLADVSQLVVCVVTAVNGFGTAAASAVAPIPAPTIVDVGWWKLNEISGNVAHDSSGHGQDAAVTAPTWENGLVSDGAGNGIAVASITTSIRSEPTSITFWFTPVLRDRAPVGFIQPFPPNVVSNDIFGLGGPAIGVNTWDNDGGGRYVVTFNCCNSDTPALVIPGQRNHYALVGDASSSILYINGSAIYTSTLLQNYTSSSGTLRFNYTNEDLNYGTNRFSAGTLRDVRVYKRALTPQEVMALVLAGPAP